MFDLAEEIIELKETPSAMTALNRLKRNHEVECSKLRSRITKYNSNEEKIKNLKGAIRDLISD